MGVRVWLPGPALFKPALQPPGDSVRPLCFSSKSFLLNESNQQPSLATKEAKLIEYLLSSFVSLKCLLFSESGVELLNFFTSNFLSFKHNIFSIETSWVPPPTITKVMQILQQRVLSEVGVFCFQSFYVAFHWLNCHCIDAIEQTEDIILTN